MTSFQTYSSTAHPEEQRLLKQKPRQCLPVRHIFALLSFLGLCNVFAMRVNLSIALVAMVNESDPSRDTAVEIQECGAHDDTFNWTYTHHKTGEFDWDQPIQGHILGAFFYGYLVMNLLGGWVIARWGSKGPFGLGVLCTSVLSLVTPCVARWNVYLLIGTRILVGVGEGMTFPAIQALLASWTPERERSQLSSFIYSGCMIGTAITMPISGLLCDSHFLGGWPSVFYVFGALGCVWFVAWHVLIYDSPAVHPHITQEEKEYIQRPARKDDLPGPPIYKSNRSVPWLSLLTSPQVLSICLAQYAGQWSFFLLLTSMPIYLKTIMGIGVKYNGLLSSLPYVAVWLSMICVGPLADRIISKEVLSIRNTRRLFTFSATMGTAVLLVLCGYAGCNRILVVSLLTLSQAVHGAVYGGVVINMLEIAPPYAGAVMGLSNGIATTSGFTAPVLVGYLTNDNQTAAQWRIVFFINAAISVVGTTFYMIFSSGEELSWARDPEVRDDKDSD